MNASVLVVDDDAALCALLETGLARRGFATACATSGDAALDRLRELPFEAIVTDLQMRGMHGLELCERIVANRPDVPVIVITAFGSLETAIAAIRAGAYDFITKPLEVDALALALERAVQHRRLGEEVKRLRGALAGQRAFDEIVGESTAMRRVQERLARVVDSDASVLLTGETGTGKEVVARALHRRSARRAGPFVAVSCAALPAPLLESELFGHVRGAFTDAHTARPGLFVHADGGTLFLDEVGDLPLELQPKLLRALQERTVRPVGGDGEVRFDVRLVAATNRDLETRVDEGRFRRDLYFRINVLNVELPPLRARGGDVLLLAQHFLEREAARVGKPVVGLSSAAAERMIAYGWPGNVRELQNCIESAVALTSYERVAVEDLPERIRRYRRSDVLIASDDPRELVTMEEVERRYVARVLEAVGGNKSLAARVLGFDRKTLHRKLERWVAAARAGGRGGES
jgi:two-component system response regulator HydG